MSFVRVNRRPLRTRKVSAPKKEWVSTVSDLSVHKATPEELSKRHEMHRSRNKVVAQWELKEKALKRAQRKPQPSSPTGLDQTRLRIIKEVFSDHYQLQDVLARSDRAMAVVKDLFGDAPRRQTGFPNITMVPNCESDSELPVLEKPEAPTQLSLLSQSMMDQQALNELEDSAGEYVEDEDVSVNSNSDVCRRTRKMRKPKVPVWITEQRQQQNVPQATSDPEGSREQSALNETVAVQRLKTSQSDGSQPSALVTRVLNPQPVPAQSGVKSRVSRTPRGRSVKAGRLDSSGLSSQSSNLSSLELLQDMLGQVETDLLCLEQKGPRGPSEQAELQHGRGLTGFSMALVSALGRITRHLTHREEEVQKEAQERRRLEEEVREQKCLINALTAECFTLREESAALQASLQGRLAELEQRLDMVILALGGLESDAAERQLEPEGGAVTGADLTSTEKDVQEQASPSPAVLLSPPRQRDSRAPLGARPRSLHMEGSNPAASASSTEESDVSCTPPSFASLPASILPRPALPADQLSHNAMLEQIAKLARQNAAIRMQLEQSHLSSAAVTASSEKSTDRLAAATTMGRQASPPTGSKPTQQCLGVGEDSVMLMEERLQELNRQSAAARAKLLELIEQQRHSTVLHASPPVSPIPARTTSPTSPTPVAGRLTPGVCASVPERGHPSQAMGISRRSALSPLSVQGGERQAITTQVDRLNGEGWFALSAHMR